MLTYSAKLKEDSRQRVGLHKLENLTVHSYHSFYHLSEESPCKTDKQMKDILANDNHLRRIWEFKERSGVKRGNALELLVLDEQQDCTPLYFAAIKKIVDRCHPKQMLVIGDKKQEINAFKGADHRFLTLADKLYPGYDWVKCQLTTSFRINLSIEIFMRESDPVCNIRHNTEKRQNAPVLFLVGKKHVVEQITFLVEEKDVDPSEIYVLCGSVKYDWVKKIANEVCQKGIGVYFPQSDYSESDIKYTLGKVWFNTFHASKGKEANYVFVLNFGHDYVQHFLKDSNSKSKAESELPNPLSVGVSRAKHQLCICFEGLKEDDDWLRMLPTLSVEKVKMLHQNKTIEIRGAHINDFKDYIPNDSKPKLKYPVTDLVDRVSGDLLDALANGVEQEPIWEPGTPLRLKEDLQSNVEGGNMEPLHFLPGIIVPALFICKNDWKRFTELFLPYCLKIFYSLKPEWQAKFTKIRDKANDDRRSWQESESFHEDLTFLALIFAQNQERLATRVHRGKYFRFGKHRSRRRNGSGYGSL